MVINLNYTSYNLNKGDDILKMSNEKKIQQPYQSKQKKYYKKIMSLLIALFMILGLSTSIVKAEENERL